MLKGPNTSPVPCPTRCRENGRLPLQTLRFNAAFALDSVLLELLMLLLHYGVGEHDDVLAFLETGGGQYGLVELRVESISCIELRWPL